MNGNSEVMKVSSGVVVDAMSAKRLHAAGGSIKASYFPDCSICLTQPRALRFDCGHLVCCEACANTLQVAGGGCPICRAQISMTLYSELPPVPGRQPTYENIDVAISRLLKALNSGESQEAQQEAAFALCLRAQEEGQGFERLIDAGVLGPLVALVSNGTESCREASRACAALTLGLIAPTAVGALVDSGAVQALLHALSAPSVAEYAALSLGNMALYDSHKTAGAIRATDGGFKPLLALVLDEGVKAATCEAAVGALTNLTEMDAVHGVVDACSSSELRTRLKELERGDSELLAATASALLANLEMVSERRPSSRSSCTNVVAVPHCKSQPTAAAQQGISQDRLRVRRGVIQMTKCVVS